MGTLNIRDETGKVIATIKGANSEAEARQIYERERAKKNEQQQFGDQPGIATREGVEVPGFGVLEPLVNYAKDVYQGIGPTEKGKEILKDKSFMEALDLYGKGLGANIYSSSTFGLGPAASARAGDKSVDQDLALSRELYGPWGDFLTGLPFGVATPLGKVLPATRAVGEFAPGAIAAAKRIGAGAVDSVLTEGLGSGIRGEEYGAGDALDSAWNALKSGSIWELLMKGKRATGKAYGEWDMSKDQKKRDEAILLMEKMRKSAGPAPAWAETVRDEMGPGFTRTLNRMGDELAPREHRAVQDQAINRMNETAARVRAEAEALHGEPLTGDRKGALQAQEATDAAFGHSPEYLPAFQANPTMPKIVRHLDLGEVNDQGRPKKTQVVIPKGYEGAIGDPNTYKDYAAARDRAQDYANRKAKEQGRKEAPTPTEVFWYTIRDLEGQDGNAKVTGNHMREIFRNQFPDIGRIIKSQADLHSQSRAAEAGGKTLSNPAEAMTPEAQRARATPEGQKTFEKAFLNDIVHRAQTKEGGGGTPRPSPANQKTAEMVLGPDRAKTLMDVLRREWDKLNLDKPVAEHTTSLQGGELSKPPGLLRRGASAAARLAAGAVTGNPAQLLMSLPGAAARLRINPSTMMDEGVAQHVVRMAGEKGLPQARQKNAWETEGNTGGTTPAIILATQQEREARRNKTARQRELNEEFTRKKK